jgi:para-nitrobenzyl esterase
MGHVVATTAGRIEGREVDGVLLFAGVPYATPPIGPRRFRAPEGHPGWDGVRDATAYGKVSVQSAGTLEALAGGAEPDWGEDCLVLNVQTPAPDDARRPVMVWIHGGGFSTGAGSIPWYDGRRFVQRGDVVVVTINYRLGVLGWLHLGELDPAFQTSGNNGLLDQLTALEWVRDNIAGFGGDPDRVTIFGESAGGMSVGTLMGTPRARGLFHRAIPQSGAAHNVTEPEQAAEVTSRIMEALRVNDVEGLQASPAEAILAAQHHVAEEITRDRASRRSGSGLGLPFGPVIDGDILPRPPLAAIRDGLSAHVPLLVGTTLEEWRLFSLMLRNIEDEATVLRRLGRLVEDPHQIVAAYRQSHDDATHDAMWTSIMTDRIFRIPAIRLAEAQVAHQPGHTFMYLFEWASTAFDGRLGSCHALEIPFVFDNLDRPGVEFFTGAGAPGELAVAMQGAWLAFARGGDPNHAGLPDWPSYDLKHRATMHFGTTNRVEHDPGPEERAAWDGVL